MSFELVSSAHFPMRSSVLYLLQVKYIKLMLQVKNGRWFGYNGYGRNQNGIRVQAAAQVRALSAGVRLVPLLCRAQHATKRFGCV